MSLARVRARVSVRARVGVGVGARVEMGGKGVYSTFTHASRRSERRKVRGSQMTFTFTNGRTGSTYIHMDRCTKPNA